MLHEAEAQGERERASRRMQEGPRVQERRGNQEREEQGQQRAGSVRARVVPRVQRAEFAVQRVPLRRCVFPKDAIVYRVRLECGGVDIRVVPARGVRVTPTWVRDLYLGVRHRVRACSIDRVTPRWMSGPRGQSPEQGALGQQ